jgi:hypothetical protein
MKVETSDDGPKFNLLKEDGVRSQAHNQDITQVLLSDGQWYAIEPGSFKFYKTGGPQQVPFVQFDMRSATTNDGERLRIEVFPATVHGIAYPVPGEVPPPEQIA